VTVRVRVSNESESATTLRLVVYDAQGRQRGVGIRVPWDSDVVVQLREDEHLVVGTPEPERGAAAA